jgi:hypothetical protein
MLLDKIEESISKRMKYLVGGSSPAFIVEKRLYQNMHRYAKLLEANKPKIKYYKSTYIEEMHTKWLK